MDKFRKKFVASISVSAALVAVIVMGTISGVPLGRSVLAAVRDQNPMGMLTGLIGLFISMSTAFGVFMLARWSNVVDEMGATRKEVTAMRTDASEMRAAATAMSEKVEKFYLWSLERMGGQRLRDEGYLWASLVVRLVSENPTFLEDCRIQKVAGGRYRISVDSVRIANFLDRFQSAISLSYLIYAPKNVVGENPAMTLLRLVHLVRVSRQRAADQGKTLQAKVRVILIDAPRPNASIFIGTRLINGAPVQFAREYHRNTSLTVRGDTPLAGQTFEEYQNTAGIADLETLVNQSALHGDEVDFADIERLVTPLLPKMDGGTAPIISAGVWNRIVKALYNGAGRKNFDVVDTGDGHIGINRIKPSISNSIERGSSVAEPPFGLDDVDEASA